MKRRRRPHTPFALRMIEAKAYWGDVIPPRSEVKLLAPWDADQGRIFRVGYYSRLDGLNCVWLVNEAGGYEQTTTQASIQQDFVTLFRSDEIDHYGTTKTPLEPIRPSS